MPQITFDNLSINFADKLIFNKINATIYKGDKIALVGRNGEGKSTLMKAINGDIDVNEGKIKIKNDINISYLNQSIPEDSNLTLFEIVASGLGEKGKIIANYQNAINDNNLQLAAKIQQQIEKLEAWEYIYQLNAILNRFGLEPTAKLKLLSGGWRRRVMLAQAMISKPDVLMLDEPTNHMDIDAILLLEKILINMTTTLILISHDREFVSHIANKIFDLDRGNLYVFNCNYVNYVKRKNNLLHAEMLENTHFAKKLAQEELWIRQGIKARRTRNEGRVRALKKMRAENIQRRAQINKAKIHLLDEDKRVSKLMFEIKNISYEIDNHKIINNFSHIILKGDKIGIIGGNGVGKSTLVKLLLGELNPNDGNIRRSKTIQLAYFDQIHSNLDLNMKAMDFVSEGKDYIDINGKSKHIIGYLHNFLFTAKQVMAPIKMLSGGEKNRLVLAKILSKPANLLVLDEPTNDLDVETLELLEEMLREYKGTLIVISHDREFLNNIVDSIIVMNGTDIMQYVGGYSDYLLIKQENIKNNNKKNKVNNKKSNNKSQKELSLIMIKIEKTEKEIEKLQQQTLTNDFYQQDNYQQILKNIANLQQNLENLYNKWSKLDG